MKLTIMDSYSSIISSFLSFLSIRWKMNRRKKKFHWQSSNKKKSSPRRENYFRIFSRLLFFFFGFKFFSEQLVFWSKQNSSNLVRGTTPGQKGIFDYDTKVENGKKMFCFSFETFRIFWVCFVFLFFWSLSIFRTKISYYYYYYPILSSKLSSHLQLSVRCTLSSFIATSGINLFR